MIILIDMDKLIESFETDSQEKVRFSEMMIRNIIELQPAVDAIPVEWLQKQYMRATMNDSFEYIRIANNHNRVIDELIDKWNHEQKVNRVIDELTDTWRKYEQEANKDGRL